MYSTVFVTSYENIPQTKLPFKSVSRLTNDDTYSNLKNAENWLKMGGGGSSEIVYVEDKGSINLNSNIGYWKEEKEILKKLL